MKSLSNQITAKTKNKTILLRDRTNGISKQLQQQQQQRGIIGAGVWPKRAKGRKGATNLHVFFPIK